MRVPLGNAAQKFLEFFVENLSKTCCIKFLDAYN